MGTGDMGGLCTYSGMRPGDIGCLPGDIGCPPGDIGFLDMYSGRFGDMYPDCGDIGGWWPGPK
jgi:hypothetical protein